MALFFDNECIILYSKRVSKCIINIRVSIDKMNEIGNKIRLSVSWDNDENFVFLTIRGLKKGEPFAAAEFLERLNAPYLGMKELNLDARAKEEPKILSGVKGDCLTGEPLSAILVRPQALSKAEGALMPGTVDLACYLSGSPEKAASSGVADEAFVFSGTLAEMFLERRGVEIQVRFLQMGESKAEAFSVDMKKEILEARGVGDSVGSKLCFTVSGLAPGLGDTVFGGVEAHISSMIMSVGGVKGIEFGKGFDFVPMRGSEANDSIVIKDGKPATLNNFSGGVDDGLTNGSDLELCCALRPSPYINREQRTVETGKMREVSIRLKGRVEASLGPRKSRVIKGALALALLDLIKMSEEEND